VETRRTERRERAAYREIEKAWKAGRTLPVEVAERYPLSRQLGENDTGINVLIDHAHQTSFTMLWGLSGQLRGLGFRASGSQATLDTVLTPGKLARVRIRVQDTLPFAWWPLPSFNVVITYQGGSASQAYIPEEREALKRFVEAGGGLIIIGNAPRNADDAKSWTLNQLAAQFGGTYTPGRTATGAGRAPVLSLGEEWEVLVKGKDGKPARARRLFGKGRVVLLEGAGAFRAGRGAKPEETKAKNALCREIVTWASGGREPAGGEPRLPTEMAGGGAIYPELEQHLGGIVLFYARNQKPELLKVFREDLLVVKKKVYEWLPSQKPDQPMYIIASAGGGGGWACNYRPKENGVISLSPKGIVSVFAHELAHTMAGPVNARGQAAGRPPHGLQGEAHAGWFQGKANAFYDEKDRTRPNRNSGTWPKGGLDWKQWRYGHWWYVWQKLDDRYGTTWYPRWYWVRATRWEDDPGHKQTYDEMVEDMCIAVGEDLFPFFGKLGVTLEKKRLERITFQGREMTLPVAPLDTGPAGAVRLDPPGDYTKPLPAPAAKS
jgi:hypothetical protein